MMIRTSTMAIARAVAAATFVITAACGGGDAADDGALGDSLGTPTMGAGDTIGAAGPMTDNMIVGQISGANAAEIAVGQVAAEKAQNADVRQFATMMVDDHQLLQGQVDSVVALLNMERAPVPDSLAQHLEQARDRLTALATGAEFDRMYMDMQVTDHENTLNALNVASTAVQNAQLRTVIDAAIPKVQQHLDRAREIRTGLGS